jgi:alpha-beta hydrolase superfamily lysophospholipase
MTPPARHELRLPSGETLVFDWAPPAAGSDVAVFVHGLGSHRRGDKALHFAERFAAIGWGFLALDLRGHGESGGSIEQLSLSRCLEDLHAVLSWLAESWPAEPSHGGQPHGGQPHGGPPPPRLLIGSSMGGAVAAWYQLRHPHPARHVALIAPSLRFPARYTELPAPDLAEWRRTGTRRFASEWIDLRIGYGLVADAAQYPYEALLAGYAAPTLILHGLLDVAVPWRESVVFLEEAACPDVDVVLVKQGDHRLTAHKGFLFDTIAAWLRQRGVLPRA